MIRDRSNIKYKTAFMLPEHSQKLRELEQSVDDVNMPLLSIDQLEMINYQIQEAQSENKEIVIDYHRNRRFHSLKGKVISVDLMLKAIRIGSEDMRHTILIKEIINATIS